MSLNPNTPGPDPNDPDTSGSAVPPYEGRKESADIGGPDEMHKDGAAVGGAANPIESDELKSTPKEDTPRGAEASPGDEQPASQASESGGSADEGVGPAHTPGTGRGEDKA